MSCQSRGSVDRVPDEDVSVLAQRPGWVVTGTVATYRPDPDGWLARIVHTLVPGRTYHRLHVAVLDSGGSARYCTAVGSVDEACQVAEAHVPNRHRAT
jgi:hypothetical protein